MKRGTNTNQSTAIGSRNKYTRYKLEEIEKINS